MKINARNLGIAASATGCIFYIPFMLILKFYPSQLLKLLGTIHMIPKLDYLRTFITVTPRAIALGLIIHIAFIYIFFWTMATIYNLFQK